MSDARTVAITLGPVLTVITTLGNGLVVWTIINPANRDRLRTPTNLLIASLALTDFLTGLVGMPLVILEAYGLPHNFIGCLSMLGFGFILRIASMLGFLILTVERFVAIAFPFKYESFMSPQSIRIMIAAQWFFSLIYAVVVVAVNLGWNFMNICVFFLIINRDMLFYMMSVWTGFIPTFIIAVL